MAKKLELLLESQEEHTNILGITATPERDADGRNMADELALKIGKNMVRHIQKKK